MRQFISIDPGRDKCGIAVMDEGGRVLERDIAPTQELGKRVAELVGAYPEVGVFVIGSGTGHDLSAKMIDEAGMKETEKIFVKEHNTTMLARKLYFKENPPRGLLRLLPAGLRVPPRPVDDYAAVIIGESYLREKGK